MKNIRIYFSSSNSTNTILLICGLLLFILPHLLISSICFILGVICIIKACTDLSLFLKYPAMRFSLFKSILLFILSLILFFRHTDIVSILPVTVGIYLFIDGVSGIVRCLDIKKSRRNYSPKIFVAPAITFGLGLILLVFPFESTTTVLRIIGIALIYEALKGFFSHRYIKRTSYKSKPLESDFVDISDDN